jgi:hypothetical protein
MTTYRHSIYHETVIIVMLLRLKIFNFGEMVTERNKCYPENRRVDCVNQLYSKNQKSVYFQRQRCV